MINLIRRRLKGGVLEDGAVHPSDEGTPQGGSISELLSNLYNHVRGHYYGVAANIRALFRCTGPWSVTGPDAV